jgi:hypothetical protein
MGNIKKRYTGKDIWRPLYSMYRYLFLIWWTPHLPTFFMWKCSELSDHLDGVSVHDTSMICDNYHCFETINWSFRAALWRYSYRYNVILTVMSILKIVSSYLLFVMSILICHNSEPLVHNSDRCFIIRTVMSILFPIYRTVMSILLFVDRLICLLWSLSSAIIQRKEDMN